ncbi:MAG TPA: HD domain-containing protein [Mariprofundaceae bacterium]|nr:HD domain-containing protein [Mariprofundaceae bacterium]
MGEKNTSSHLPVDALPDSLHAVCQSIGKAGGRAWLVGGCVRDLASGLRPKDFDLEVYGLSAERLVNIVSPLGRCQHVGKQFGVLKLWHHGLEIDIALPRQEKKTASGHRGFEVSCDPDLTPEAATLRRDFTINAMMLDPLSGALLDLHHGQEDLRNRVLRHVSPAFGEDPLRPLRAMQFAARFQLDLASETAEMCRRMLPEAPSLPGSRIWQEWQKWAHAPHPSYGMKILQETGWLGLYPGIHALLHCPQDADWHPEGDVWIHTLQVVDQAARIANRNGLDQETHEYLVFAALCHDIGKPETTVSYDNGRIGSPGHSQAGVKLSLQFLQAIHAPKRMGQFVRPLILEHMTHMHGGPTAHAVRRLAYRLKPANIELWEMLVEADASGRAPAPASRPALAWLDLATEMQQNKSEATPILTGQMLMDLGVSPGPGMGELLKMAYAAQLDGSIHDQASAISWCLRQLEQKPGKESPGD